MTSKKIDDDLTKRAINKFGIWLFPALLIWLLLTNCSRSNDGRIIHPVDTRPGKLVPYHEATAEETQIYSQVYETLLKLGPDGKSMVGNLARKWAFADSNRCLRIDLKEDIPFHDGSMLDADGAKMSIEWLKKNKASPFLESVRRVDIVGKYAFIIHFFKADPRFIYYLASPDGIVMISPRAISSQSVLSRPVGTGPFYFKTRDSIDIELAAFSKYRNRGGNVRKIIFRYYPYSEELKTAFINDELDLVYMVDGYSIDRFQWSGKIKYLVQKPLYTSILGFNLKNKIAADKRFRKAVLYALDLKKISFNLNRGGAVPATNPLPQVFPGFEEIKQDEFNLSKAKNQINRLNMKNKIVNLFYLSHTMIRRTYIQVLISELAKAGIQVRAIGIKSWESYTRAIKSDSAAMFMYGWKSDIIGDAGNFLHALFFSKSKFNVFHYHNREVDRLLLQSRSEFDGEKRQMIYRKLLLQILDDTPVVFARHLKEYYAFNSNKIKSIEMSPYGIINYKDVILDEKY